MILEETKIGEDRQNRSYIIVNASYPFFDDN